MSINGRVPSLGTREWQPRWRSSRRLCRSCGHVISASPTHSISLGPLLWGGRFLPDMSMRYWILAGDKRANDLQSMVLPDIFGLWPGAAVEGLRTEDRVFIWQSRPDTGVVGLGEIDHVLPTADGLPKDCFV